MKQEILVVHTVCDSEAICKAYAKSHFLELSLCKLSL